jgi:ATP-dependent exoDNAse (exonuclease V) beta subunit
MSELVDSLARERFARETDQPFSVIAPAGVGKTHAIIERVSRMLQAGGAPIALVTYTKKAAAEMRDRLEKKLSRAGKIMPCERIFIGTIHSLCAELMQKFRAAWGLSPNFEIAANIDALWARYGEEVPNPLADLPIEVQERCWRHFPKFDLSLIAGVPSDVCQAREFRDVPPFDFATLNKAKIEGRHGSIVKRLQAWAQNYTALVQEKGGGDYSFPELPAAPKETSEAWPLYQEAFGSYEQWRATEGVRYARYLCGKFRQWRRSRGLYLYDDLIDVVREKIGGGGFFSVVLDEAQDTSPEQLELLKKLAIEKDGKLQLTMVGDPQQSIYAARASLPHYLKMHRELIEKRGARELTFEVTFRCSQKVVDWVNIAGTSGGLLSKSQTQAAFVSLEPRPDVAAGEVCRWKISGGLPEAGAPAEERDWSFARAFARQFRELELAPSRAHQVAIIAPRRDWLFKLAATLAENGFRAQLHADSGGATVSERILQAIVHLMAYPFDSFELLGFLRELSMVDDRTLAAVAQKNPELLTIAAAPMPGSISPALFDELSLLHQAYKNHLDEPLDKAILGFVQDARIDQRVFALSRIYGEDLKSRWQAELSNILARATAGITARELLKTFDANDAEIPVEPGALQLMTMHKAKGLEWPVVIIPYLHRPNHSHKNVYPIVDPASGGAALSWRCPQEPLKLAQKENFERLLYVAMTRAKEQLVLVDDSDFYAESENSAAQLLKIRAGDSLHEAFESLPSPTRLAVGNTEEPKAVEVSDVAALRENPDKRLIPSTTPSSLVAAEHRVETEEPAIGGVDYGDFWHNLWNTRKPDPGWLKEELQKRIKTGAYAARAAGELEKLSRTPLWKILTDPKNKFDAEVPFFALCENTVLEGRADLVVKTPEKTIVVDWKTDQLPVEKIKAVYAPQLDAYKLAFEKLTGGAVEVYFYSTLHAAVVSTSEQSV